MPNRKRPAPQGRDRGNGEPAAGAPGTLPTAPDLSYIAEDLRPLAMPIGELQFDPINARKHGERNIDAIAASLRQYGQRRPIVVNRRNNNVTEAGNGVLQAALGLGWTHIAVVKVDDDAARAAGFALADNRTAELAAWSPHELESLISLVDVSDPGIKRMIDSLERENNRVLKRLNESADPLPAIPPGPSLLHLATCPQCGHQFQPGAE